MKNAMPLGGVENKGAICMRATDRCLINRHGANYSNDGAMLA